VNVWSKWIPPYFSEGNAEITKLNFECNHTTIWISVTDFWAPFEFSLVPLSQFQIWERGPSAVESNFIVIKIVLLLNLLTFQVVIESSHPLLGIFDNEIKAKSEGKSFPWSFSRDLNFGRRRLIEHNKKT